MSVHPECKARPYAASVWRDGKSVYLGWFATAEEAALHVARTPEAQAAAQAAAALPPPMTAAEALAQAEAEGLTLARSDNQSGFRHVSVHPGSKARPYRQACGAMARASTSAASPRPRRRRCTSPERLRATGCRGPAAADDSGRGAGAGGGGGSDAGAL